MAFRSRTKYAVVSAQRTALIGIDIGTARLRVIVGEVDAAGMLHVSWFKTAPSAGIYSGAVGDLNALGLALSALLEDIPEDLADGAQELLVAVSGGCIVSENVQSSVRVQNTITLQDCRHCIEEAWLNCSKQPGEYERMHADPHYYIGEVPAPAPLDLAASRLDARVHLILCSRDHQRNIESALHKVSAEIGPGKFVFSGIAAAEAVLTEDDRNIGVGLIDIGAGTVNVAVYLRGQLIMSFGFNRGGEKITRGIAMRWGLSMKHAELIKCKFGAADPELLDGGDAKLSVTQSRGCVSEEIIISKSELADCIKIELQDLFNSVRDQIERQAKKMDITFQLGAGFVLTGGVAQTRGIEETAGRALSMNGSFVKVRVMPPPAVNWGDYVPAGQDGPDCAVAAGLLRFGRRDLNCRRTEREPEEENAGRVRRFFRAVRIWLAREL